MTQTLKSSFEGNPRPQGIGATLYMSQRLLDRCRYRRLTSGKAGTVLVVDAGYFIQAESIRGFEQNGWRVIPVPLEPVEQFIEKLLTAVVMHRPDMLFTVNHLGFDQNGLLTELLEIIGMPVVSWFVDSPAYILLDHNLNASPLVMTPIWEREYQDFLSGFGFQHTFHLPLAGDPGLFHCHSALSDVRCQPSAVDSYTLNQVGFVGDSMINPAMEWREKCVSIPESRRIINEAAAELVKNRRLKPVELLDDVLNQMPDKNISINKEEVLTFASAIVLEATRQYRHNMVNNFKDADLHIFGDRGWHEYAPPNVVIHGGVDYYSELPTLYKSTRINLNCTSMQMPTAVNQRVFDAPLAGGFLLTDHQEDLDILFDMKKETATFSCTDELRELTSYYLAHDSLRETTVRSAYERILNEHTYRHRIEKIIEYARRVFGESVAHPSADGLSAMSNVP